MHFPESKLEFQCGEVNSPSPLSAQSLGQTGNFSLSLSLSLSGPPNPAAALASNSVGERDRLDSILQIQPPARKKLQPLHKRRCGA